MTQSRFLYNNYIIALSCSDNYLGEEGAKILGKALENNELITDLALKGNDLGDAGISAICEALRKRKGRIRSLDLGNNK